MCFSLSYVRSYNTKRQIGHEAAQDDRRLRTNQTFDQAACLAAQERDLAAAGATKMFTEQVSSIAKRDRLA
jgi:hypothetical protein